DEFTVSVPSLPPVPDCAATASAVLPEAPPSLSCVVPLAPPRYTTHWLDPLEYSTSWWPSPLTSANPNVVQLDDQLGRTTGVCPTPLLLSCSSVTCAA